MWNELEQRWTGAAVKLPGRFMKCKVDVDPSHFILGFTTKETGNMTGKFQGFHSPHMCVIVSEAQAVSDSIFDQIHGILTSETNLLILIGNPLRTSGTFAKMIKDTTNNIVIHLDATDSPNYRHKRTIIPGMASYDWVEDKRKRWGVDHPLWFSRVLGQLPPGGIDTIFGPELIATGQRQDVRSTHIKRTVACDPAGMGDDECVISGMETGIEIKKDIMPQSRADAVCSHVLQMVKEVTANYVLMETDGMGGPIYDFMLKLKPKDVRVEGFQMGGAADDDEHYCNKRAEAYFFAKDQVEKGLAKIPNDIYLEEELMETRYFYNLRGKIQIEAKEDIKERLGRSPNRADAWVIGVWAQAKAPRIFPSDAWSVSHKQSDVSVTIASAMGA